MFEMPNGIVIYLCSACLDFHVGWWCRTEISGRECGTVNRLGEKWCGVCGTECPRQVALIATLARTAPFKVPDRWPITTLAKN